MVGQPLRARVHSPPTAYATRSMEAFAAALPAEHRRLLEEMRPWYKDENGIYVHGGMPRGGHPSEFKEEILVWTGSNSMTRLDKPVVFGHEPQRGGRPLDLPGRNRPGHRLRCHGRAAHCRDAARQFVQPVGCTGRGCRGGRCTAGKSRKGVPPVGAGLRHRARSDVRHAYRFLSASPVTRQMPFCGWFIPPRSSEVAENRADGFIIYNFVPANPPTPGGATISSIGTRRRRSILAGEHHPFLVAAEVEHLEGVPIEDQDITDALRQVERHPDLKICSFGTPFLNTSITASGRRECRYPHRGRGRRWQCRRGSASRAGEQSLHRKHARTRARGRGGYPRSGQGRWRSGSGR